MNSTHDLRIPLCIMAFPAKENRTHNQYRLFFDLVSRWESRPYAPVPTERWSSHQIEYRCSRVSVRRGRGTYIHVCASHSEATTSITGEALESDEAAVSENIFLRTVSMLALPSAWE